MEKYDLTATIKIDGVESFRYRAELELLDLLFDASGHDGQTYVPGPKIEQLFSERRCGAHWNALENLYVTFKLVERPPNTNMERWRPSPAAQRWKDEYARQLTVVRGDQHEPASKTAEPSPAPVKRGRGRPRKTPVVTGAEAASPELNG